jgi:membrane protease YdiL (CAAX protease family)
MLIKTVSNWMKSHPLALFFSLALVITWGLLIVLSLTLTGLVNESELLDVVFLSSTARLALYGPVLAGMMVTRWVTPEQNPGSARKRWLTFGNVWIIALVVSALGLQQESNSNIGLIPLLIISIPLALLPAFVFSSAFSKVASLRDYLSTLVHPRGHFVWYLVALLTFPVVQFLGIVITNLLDSQPPLFNVHFAPGILYASLIAFASVFFYSGGVNEEGGWRGFAQRRLQARSSPLVANLLLWIYLVVWHIPNDIVQYSEGGYLLIRIGLYPFITILFGFVYNRTKGAILATALFHASMNSMNTLQAALPFTNAGSVLLVALAIFAILSDRMWKKLPSDHPAVYESPGDAAQPSAEPTPTLAS